MSVTLYRKYRPRFWSDVAGQKHVKDTLAFEVASGQIAHAYLLTGPRGVGKTTVARIFAKAINCTGRKKGSGEPCDACDSCRALNDNNCLDIIEIDAASNRGIDSVRENIIENARFSPSRLAYKVFIIDEVHMLTTEAFNALLKTLEEPPARVVFLLATTELHKVPATVVSRCQRFDLRKIPVVEVVERLRSLVEREKMKVEDGVLAEIARQSEGCLRDAEGLLGKLLATADGKKVTNESALAVLPRSDWEAAAKLVDALVARDAAAALAAVGECLDAGADVEQFADEATELLRKALLAKIAGSADLFKADLDESRLKRVAGWAAAAEVGFLVRALEVMLEKRRELKGSHPVQLPLELAVVIICEGEEGARGAEEAEEKAGTQKDRHSSAVPGAARSAGSREPESVIVRTVENVVSSRATPSERSESKESAAISSAPEEVRIEPVAGENIVTVTIEEVHKVWSECVKKVSAVSHSLSLLLGAARPVDVEGQKIRIGSGFRFYKDKLNEGRTRRMLEDALSEALGRKVLIEGVTLENSEEMMHIDVAETAPAQPEMAATAPESADGASKIAAAFGGKIVN